MEGSRIHWTRGQLYELVWEKPITHAAKELGISDRGLAKKCAVYNIPVPPRGYWAKLEHGKKVRKIPLPLDNSEFSEFIYFKPVKTHDEPEPDPRASLTQEQLALAEAFVLPKKISRYHKVISAARSQHSKNRLDNYGRVEFLRSQTHPGIKVTPQTFDRACRFLQSLSDLFKQLGWELVSTNQLGKPLHSAVFSKDDLDIFYEIIERVSQLPIKPKPERKRETRFNYPDFDSLLFQRQEYKASGKLEFSINIYHDQKLKTRWKDSETGLIEDQLVDICCSVASAFEIERIRRIESIRREKEYARHQQEMIERRQREQEEKERQQHLFNMADNLEKIQRIKRLLQHVNQNYPKSDELEQWTAWVHQVIKELNPISDLDALLERGNLSEK